MAAGQVFARNAQLAVGLAADREYDRVVEPLEILDLDVVADLDVAEEAEALARRGFLVDPDHRLDLGMVGRDAAADQAKRGGEAVEEVDLGVRLCVFEDVLGGVEAGGAGADDGDADGVLFGSDLGHFLYRAGGWRWTAYDRRRRARRIRKRPGRASRPARPLDGIESAERAMSPGPV
jgi:hypothetical protein